MLKEIKVKVNSNNKLSAEQKQDLIIEYQSGKTATELANKYSVTYSSIIGLLKRRDIKIVKRGNRKHTFDQCFFDKIDTENKAYILGFLYADGWNTISYNGKPSYTIGLEIQKRDIEIINYIRDSLNYKGNSVFFRKREPTYIGKQKITPGEVCSIRFSSKYMSLNLSKIGMCQKKSLILDFPSEKIIPKNLMHHFIRGYFDGDGSFSTNKNGNIFWHIISSDLFCKKISLFLKKELKINVNPYKDGKISRITIGGNKNVIKLVDWMYNNSTFYLKRKYEKFVKFLREYQNKDFKMDNNITATIDRKYIFDKYLK